MEILYRMNKFINNINNINKMEIIRLINDFDFKSEEELLEIFIASKIKILNRMICENRENEPNFINSFSDSYLDKIISVKSEKRIIDYPETTVNVEGIIPKIISNGENGEICVIQFLLEDGSILFENAELIKEVKPQILVGDESLLEIDKPSISNSFNQIPISHNFFDQNMENTINKIEQESCSIIKSFNLQNDSFSENSNKNLEKNNCLRYDVVEEMLKNVSKEDENKTSNLKLTKLDNPSIANEEKLSRSYLTSSESKKLLKINGDLFLDFKIVTSPDCTNSPLKNNSKTAAVVVSEDLSSISMIVDDSKGSLIKIVKENKDLKHKVEMFSLLSSKKLDKLKVSNLSSKNFNQLVTEIKKSQTKLINNLKRLKVKRLIFLLPKDFNSKKKRKNFSPLDYYLATLFIDLNKKISKGSTSLKQIIGVDKNSKNNYSRFVDFKNSLFPNLFYYSEQKMSKKDGDKLGDINQALNLFRFFDPSITYSK
jgi:hypothetical protein